MKFDLTDEQKLIVNSTRRMMEKEIKPILEAHDRFTPLSREVVREIFTKVIPLGFLGSVIPEEGGGAGLDYLTYGLMFEQLDPIISTIVFIHSIAASNIYHLSTPEQQSRFMPNLLSGQRIACVAITEPNVGSNPADIETTAVEDGDFYIINGTKTFITNGDLADIAVVAVSLDRKLGGKGLARIIVDRTQSPYQVRSLDMMCEHSYLAELIFQDCRVPRANMLGEKGRGLRDTLKIFEVARCYVALMAVSLAQRAIDASVKYAKERRQFGRPIGSFQLIQEMIADMAAETEAARLLTYRALYNIDQGRRSVTESSIAKSYATEAAVRVTSKAVQIHGGYGLSKEYPVEQYFRTARTLTIPDGTTQIQKMIIAREILEMNAFK